MAMTGYLTLEGKNQGKIEGDCTQKGREKTLLVYAIKHGVEIPRDSLSGLPTGQRVHKPFIITKHVDPSSPLLYQACTSGEQMKTWQLDYYRINDKGQEELYFQVKLENAIVVAIEHYKPNTLDATQKALPDLEDVAFTYSKITWSHKTANKEAEDDWRAPKEG
ncbi:MAG: type secretion system secreted protein Hcp [Desulfonauticus sp.]|jgi:type VI secretion system secreted protein Hcp|nr:type secretion system secreted protein Hcp [Desulfonauticus sp.]